MKLFAYKYHLYVLGLMFLTATLVFFAVDSRGVGYAGRSCIKMSVQITNIGAYGFVVPENIYSNFEQLCRVDIRPGVVEEEEGGIWF